jgi:hypothetical protein
VRYHRLTLALALMAATPFATAGNDAFSSGVSLAAPLAIPHTTQLDMDLRSRRRGRGPGKFETPDFLDVTPGLTPFAFPRNGDMRSRLLTPELKRTPLVGWIAENLYRSKREKGWCLEVDPGEGEYVVFYRVHLK